MANTPNYFIKPIKIMKNFKEFIHEWVFLCLHMKRTRLFDRLLPCFFVLLLTLFSLNSFAQSKKVTLSLKDVPLSVVLKSITNQTGYTFFYSEDIAANKNFSVSIKNEELGAALKKILAGSAIDYKIEGSRVVLFKESHQKSGKNVAVVKVYGNDMTPLPGATVTYQNGQKSTVTNIEGAVALNLQKGDVVKVTFIGFKPSEHVWQGQHELFVKLTEDAKAFNEVIVTGFSTVSKERSTGSVSVVKGDALTKNVNLNMTSSLEGRVAGLSTYKGGLAIRGTTTLSSNSQALVVVDGLPIEGGINDINPADVESVNILKDAASASIYGSRAANGIIVITTKNADRNKTSFDFSYSLAITPKNRISNFNLASTSDIIDYERYCLENNPNFKRNPLNFFLDKDDYASSYSPIYKLYYDEIRGSITAEEKEKAIDNMRKYDYRKEFERLFYQNSITQQYNMAFRKGADKSSISLSANYQKYQYDTKNNNYDALILNFKNALSLGSRVSLNYGFYGNFAKQNSTLNLGSRVSELPYQRVLNDDGSRSQIVKNNYSLNDNLVKKGLYSMTFNPLDEMETAYSKYSSTQLRGFADVNIKLFEGLKYNAKFQYEKYFSKTQDTYEKPSYYMRQTINRFAVVNANNSIKYYIPNNGKLLTRQNEADNYTFRNQIDFKQRIFEGLTLDAFAGTEYRQFLNTGVTTEIYGYDPKKFLSGEPVNWEELRNGVYGALDPYWYATMNSSEGSSYVLNREFSMYMNGSLNYSNRYILAGSWRVDKTNLFGVDARNRNRPLWSVSGSWNASSEKFMENVNWIQNLKLRASYGANGNVDRGTSPYMLARMIKSDDVDAYASIINTPPNKSLRWEKTEIFNAGIDFSLFKRRLSGSIDLYHKYTSDLIANKVLDFSSGFDRAKLNNGEMVNQGVEFSLSYSWLSNDAWNISSNAVAAYNKNTIKKINFRPQTASQLIEYPTSYYRNNDPFNSMYSYRYAGLTETGDPSVYDKLGNVVKNNGSMSDPDALVFSGIVNPSLTGSFNQSVQYKNFVLDLNFVMYGGHKLRLDVTPLYSYQITDGLISDDISKRWTPENTSSTIPRFPVYDAPGDRNKFWKYADTHVVSANMIKLRNASIAYNFGPQLLSKLKVKSFQLKLQVNNAWFWSAAGNGIDPENYDPIAGVRTGMGTNVPTFLFGANLSF